jgi:AcrR family transcriptional regulator
VSTSKAQRDTYHHGDLRNALIAAGLVLLAEAGHDALTLRGVARRAGVSHNAPYQHFADKEALIAAIAEQGFVRLAASVEASQAGLDTADTAARLAAAGTSYVRFALDYPAYLSVMFGPLPASDYPALAEAAFAALQQIVRIAAPRPDAGEIAMAVWMLAQGISTIAIAQKLPPALARGRDAPALAETCIRMACAGLLRP